jgi:hypothetical protein
MDANPLARLAHLSRWVLYQIDPKSGIFDALPEQSSRHKPRGVGIRSSEPRSLQSSR